MIKIMVPQQLETSSVSKLYLKEFITVIKHNNHFINNNNTIHQLISFFKGKFVAEAKFLDPELQPKYIEHIKNRDVEAIENLLTNKAVEEALLKRLRRKALTYGQDISEHGESNLDNLQTTKQLKINVDIVVDLYEKWVIPLTKEVEVEYLLKRLDE